MLLEDIILEEQEGAEHLEKLLGTNQKMAGATKEERSGKVG